MTFMFHHVSICLSALLAVATGAVQDGRNDPAGGKPAQGESGSAAAKKAPSLLKNGSFEGEIGAGYGNNYGSWAPSVPASQSAKFEFDTKLACDGEQSLALKNFDPKVQVPLSFSQAIFSNELAKWQGRELKISACLRTEEAEFADVRVEAIDAKGKSIDWLSLTGGGIGGTREWKKSEVSLIVSEGIAMLRVHCVLQGQGAAWFDDVRLTVVSLDKSKHLEPVLGEALERFCRFLRAKRGSEENDARQELETLRPTATLEMVRSVFSKGFSYPGPKGGASADEDLRQGGRTVYQVSLPTGYDAKKRWPMLLDLSKPGVGQPWADGEGKRFLVVRPKNLSVGRGADDAGISESDAISVLPEILAVLRDVRAKYSVESDKVCILGEGTRASLAAVAALGNRGEFCAAVMVRPSNLEFNELLANGSGLPVFLALEGGDRSPLAPKFEFLRSKGVTLVVRDLDPARIAAAALGGEVFRWFEGKSRPALGKDFEEVLPAHAEAGSFSIRVLSYAPGAGKAGSPAKIKAKVGEKRRLEIEAQGIRRLRVLLSLDELGLPGETEILVNGEVRYQARPPFDFDNFVELLRSQADPKRVWGAQIDIDVD